MADETFQDQVERVTAYFKELLDATPDKAVSLSDNDKKDLAGDPDPSNPNNLEEAVVAALNAEGIPAVHWQGQAIAAMTQEILDADGRASGRIAE